MFLMVKWRLGELLWKDVISLSFNLKWNLRKIQKLLKGSRLSDCTTRWSQSVWKQIVRILIPWPKDNSVLSTCRVFRFQLDVFGSVTRDKPIWLLRVTSKEKVMKMMEIESSSSGLYILGDSTTFMIELKHHWRDSGSGYYSELEDEASCNISRTLQLQIQRNLYSLSSPALYELLSNTWWSSQTWYDFWLAYYFNICLLESYLVSKLLPLMIQGTHNTTICAVIPWLYYMWTNVTCAR